MRKLTVDLGELAFAMESNFAETRTYLDLETGEVVAVGDDIRGELEAIYEQMEPDEPADSPRFLELVAQRGLPDWQRQQLLVADQVERGYGERFIAVPQVDSHEAYRDMEDFIATVRSPHIRELLEVAITGRAHFVGSRTCCWATRASGSAGSRSGTSACSNGCVSGSRTPIGRISSLLMPGKQRKSVRTALTKVEKLLFENEW